MYVKKLHLKNFRCYDDFEIDFDKRVTVLVGLNGRGKTAILDGLRLALSALNRLAIPFCCDDVRKVPIRENKKLVRMEQVYPVQLETVVGRYKIQRVLGKPASENIFIKKGKQKLGKYTEIFAYYGTDRMAFIEEFIKEESPQVFQGKFPVIKKALDFLLKPYPAWVEYNEELKSIVIRDSIEGEQLITVASDGARSVMGMAADIAMRMAMANPDMGPEMLKLVPGIVLIDEIDLHLHPGWQQKVMNLFLKLFPKVQFVVSTHSPLVLSTVEPERIRILSDMGNTVYVPEFSLGADCNQILKEIQHVEGRAGDLPIVRCLNKYLDLVAKDKFDTPEALKLRQHLDQWGSGRDPVLNRVDMDIRLRQLRRKK